MIAATEAESPALAHERTPLLCSPPPPIISGTSSTNNSDDSKPVPTAGLGLHGKDVDCAKSGIGGGSSDGFKGVVAVMLLGSLSLLKHLRFNHHGKYQGPFKLIRLVSRCLHLQCRQYYYSCHVRDHLLSARES